MNLGIMLSRHSVIYTYCYLGIHESRHKVLGIREIGKSVLDIHVLDINVLGIMLLSQYSKKFGLEITSPYAF